MRVRVRVRVRERDGNCKRGGEGVGGGEALGAKVVDVIILRYRKLEEEK